MNPRHASYRRPPLACLVLSAALAAPLAAPLAGALASSAQAAAAAQSPASTEPDSTFTAGVERFTFDREHVLGTSLHLALDAPTREHAATLEQVAVDELERLARILSGHDEASEWRALAAAREPRAVSPELREVLQQCDAWAARTDGAFQPGVSALTALWRAAATLGAPPGDVALAAAAAAAREACWRIDADAGTVEVLAAVPPTLDALAKGYCVDRAVAALVTAGCTGGVLEVGGDLRVFGAGAHEVAVQDPWRTADNAPPLLVLAVADRAVATSGGYARGFDVAGVHHSHILDPRTGRPADRVAQATVVAPDAVTADALATALCVLAPEEGLALVARTPGVECLVLEQEGRRRHTSPGFEALVREAPLAEPAPGALATDVFTRGHVVLAFELASFAEEGGQRGRRKGGYRRPYVAAWVEGPDGAAVRTLALWVEKPKWIPDLRRWIKHYRGATERAEAVTRATRGPGAYTLEWRGETDDGGASPPGTYTVCLEVVREHGGTSLLRREVVLDGAPFTHTLEAGGEVAAASVAYVLELAPGGAPREAAPGDDAAREGR